MSVAVITLSDHGARLARRLVQNSPTWRVYVHEAVGVEIDDSALFSGECAGEAAGRENPPFPPLQKGGVRKPPIPSSEAQGHCEGAGPKQSLERNERRSFRVPSRASWDLTPANDRMDEEEISDPGIPPFDEGDLSISPLGKGKAGEILEGRQYRIGRFSRIADLTAELFHQCTGLVYIAPCGVVVRALAPHLKHKTTDPAVVVVDAGGRWAISLLSGHEGGANDLAVAVANCLGSEPVISTTTEAVKRLIIGIGCRRGVDAQTIVRAITSTLQEARRDLAEVRMLASADVKRNERGLQIAAKELGIPLRFIESAEIRECLRPFEASRFVEEQVNVPAVAEPCALLAGRRTRLLAPKRIHNGVTVAVAEESSLSWE
jgi:cobalt-precorrin 5A hydrolase